MNFPKPIQRSAIPAAAHAVSKLGITGVIQRSTLIVSVDKDMDPSVGGHVRRLLKSNVNATVVDIDTMNQKPLSADQLKGVDKLYFVAHGYGDMIGDMWSAEQVKNLLLTNETKKVWQVKQFILVACNSANEKYTSMEQPKTFAELLHADLSSEANVPLTLVAPSGFGYTDIEGRLRVVPLEKQTEYMKKVKELDKIKQSNPQEYVRQAKALLDEYAPVGTGLKTFSSELPMTETLPLLHNQTSSDEEDVSCSCWPFWPFTLCFSK